VNGMGEHILVQCPHCGARFRVAEKTLTKANGWALCGECFEPFSALTHRLPKLEPSPSTPFDEVGVGSGKDDPTRSREPSIPLAFTAADATLASSIRFDSSPPSEPRQSTAPNLPPAAPARTESAAELGFPSPATMTAAGAIDSPPLIPLPRQPSLVARLMTFLLFLLLLVTALWQLLWVAHTPLIRLYPSLYPIWVQACAEIGCTIALPADRDLLRIDDARLIKERDPTYYSMEVTISNTAPYPMAWPHLAITLTDGLGRALVRKILSPSDWGAPQEYPMRARERLSLSLTLQTFESGIVGFEVVPFYP